ncbi:5096_t:CDS:2 [Dentiscutata heterogama]|uniref:5096_t:CDS:1 n=1 Tax=Dentiscutata heterogama TaxID=1316150 RepID=A0ACA9K7W1_9GLOM|nr:5096_t:CDS:2 [Dentiscutata heterogama]
MTLHFCCNYNALYVYARDQRTQQWITPNTSGNFTAVERKSATCIVSGNEIYIYGGYDDLFSMIKLDTLNLIWSTYYPGFIAPIGLLGYSATLLDNASILYMGTTSGNIPYSRCDHGSIYIPQYNQILIFYGYPDSSFVALDTLNFVWSYPSVSINNGLQYQLIRFTSILIGAYILIAFGNDHISDNFSNNVFLLDVSQKNNYKWSTSYDPTKQLQSITTTTTSVISPTSNISHDSLPVNIGAIIGGIFGGIAGIIILSTAAVIAIKKYGNPPLFTSEEETSNQPES